jgi:UPF0755 protein
LLVTFPSVPKSLSRLLSVVLLLCVATLGAFAWWATRPLALHGNPVEFRLLNGTSVRAAVRQLNEAGVELSPTLAIWGVRLSGAQTAIKAGSYAVHQGVTPYELFLKLTRGDVSQVEVNLPAGWSFRQWRNRLDAQPNLEHLTAGLADEAVMERLGAPGGSPEGLFFPDTYLSDKHSSDLELLERAYRAMNERIRQEWEGRASNLPYQSAYQALVMASLIEKETGRAADRPLVAAVFVNRLRRGMLLQTDPSVIYGLGTRFDGNLRKVDMLTDTPYNTYTRGGLPPTPIAMPSLASLQAALHPAGSEVLYFVARGDGSSQFSRTLSEHNLAVDRYQRGGH